MEENKHFENYMEFPPMPPCSDCTENACNEDNCKQTAYQYADISLPITLEPTVEINNVELECCDEPFVTCQEASCNHILNVTVKQKICVKIPIDYTITACLVEKNISIDCECNMP